MFLHTPPLQHYDVAGGPRQVPVIPIANIGSFQGYFYKEN